MHGSFSKSLYLLATKPNLKTVNRRYNDPIDGDKNNQAVLNDGWSPEGGQKAKITQWL